MAEVENSGSSVGAELDEMIAEYKAKSTDMSYTEQQRVDSKEIAETLIQLRSGGQNPPPMTRSSNNTNYGSAAAAILAWGVQAFR